MAAKKKAKPKVTSVTQDLFLVVGEFDADVVEALPTSRKCFDCKQDVAIKPGTYEFYDAVEDESLTTICMPELKRLFPLLAKAKIGTAFKLQVTISKM